MMKKLLLVMFVLIAMTSIAFATPTVTHNTPITGTTLIGTHSYVIDFNVMDENGNGTIGVANTLQVYLSTTAGTRSILLLSDTNLSNATTVLCADYNFFYTQDCNATITIPSFETVPMGDYYLDYNFGAEVAGVNTDTYGSSGRLIITQGMPSGTASMIALALFIAAAGLAVFFVMRIAKGETTVSESLGVAIAVIVLIIVGWTLYGISVVPI